MFGFALILAAGISFFLSDELVKKYDKSHVQSEVQEIKKNPHVIKVKLTNTVKKFIFTTYEYQYVIDKKQYTYKKKKILPAKTFKPENEVILYYSKYPEAATEAEYVGSIKNKRPIIAIVIFVAVFAFLLFLQYFSEKS